LPPKAQNTHTHTHTLPAAELFNYQRRSHDDIIASVLSARLHTQRTSCWIMEKHTHSKTPTHTNRNTATKQLHCPALIFPFMQQRAANFPQHMNTYTYVIAVHISQNSFRSRL